MGLRTFPDHQAYGMLGLILLGLVANVQAEPQVDKDAGVDFANSLIGTVQALPGTSDPVSQVPGYGGSMTLPQADYYTNQDLGNLQNDAVTGVLTGSAGEAATWGYELSQQPNIPFTATDPLISGATQTATDALVSPEALTVKTGDCVTSDVITSDTTIEHCTAWYQPVQHTCSNTLDVNVTWETQSSCPIGQTFNEVQGSHTTVYGNLPVGARPYCNPSSGDTVAMQFYLNGSWRNIAVSVNQAAYTYTGIYGISINGVSRIPVFVQGTCNGNDCTYRIQYVEIFSFTGPQRVCNYATHSLVPRGYTDYMFTPYYSYGYPLYPDGLHCGVATTLAFSFEKPHATQIPTVTESWNDGCTHLEAQVQ